MINNIILQLEKIKSINPLIYHITNYVTVNDCANICLAIGASPIMADDMEEIGDITAIASSLVINTGTLNKRTAEAMISAGVEANKRGIPVVLDPVGAGASGLRNETVLQLLEKVKFSVIRGNLSEILYLTEGHANTKGVDAADEDRAFSSVKIASRCADALGCTVAITGKTDVVSDGQRVLCINNGHEMLSKVTGTGCMCSSLIGAFCGANNDMLMAAAGGIICMGIAGELAYEVSEKAGLGSFHISLIDAIGNMSRQILIERAKIYAPSY